MAYEKVGGAGENRVVSPLSYQVVPSVGRKGRKRGGFRVLRIAVLLLILLFVALDTLFSQARSQAWEHPLRVVVYPINASGSPEVDEYLATLSDSSYAGVEQFLVDEVVRYGLPIRDPLDVRIGPVLVETPPLPPSNGETLQVMWWSLKMRYWSYAVDSYDGPKPTIKVFVLYHAAQDDKRLLHSAALRKGMVSVVHAFAAEKRVGMNNVVIAHEMLHTLGATDKYDLADNRPLYPLGYADPDQMPLYPQAYAEIMAGRIPVSETEWRMPRNLVQARIGITTAREIGWLD